MAIEKETVTVSSHDPKQGMEQSTSKQDINIRITMTSKNLKNLESVANALVLRAKERGLDIKGPIRLPTKVLHITTRKTPCGEGSKTWDRYEMRIRKRIIDLVASPEMVKQITAFKMEPYVDIEVMIKN